MPRRTTSLWSDDHNTTGATTPTATLEVHSISGEITLIQGNLLAASAAASRARLSVRTPVGRRILASGHGEDEGRFVISPDEQLDRSGSFRLRTDAFVAVLGVDAVERISRRADDHAQLVPRADHERRGS
jgi:hypothetical protein